MRRKPTYISAVVSIALVLFILGFFALLTLHGRKLVNLYKEKVDIWLELRPGISETDISRVVADLRAHPWVKPETLAFVTKEQAAKTMKEDLGDESLLEDYPDMLRDVLRFNVKAEFLDKQKLTEWREEIKQDSLVADLFIEAVSTGNAGKNLENLSWMLLGIGILLTFAAVLLIHNTIRLAMYSNRFLIKNQELVGASWAFITRPYIIRSIWNGIISALMACAGLILLWQAAKSQIPELEQLQDLNLLLGIFLGLVALGIAISGLSTWFVVNKFLKMRIDDLY